MLNRVGVLCVDDEPQVVRGLALHLRRHYDVEAAYGGLEALEVIRRKGPFAVVLSDMRMPGMDGATMLRHARDLAPDTVRMLLTGDIDVSAAVSAVNDGQIFRFLTKPCPPEPLRLAVDAAAEQHRLVTAERVLLEQTLHGCIKALVDVLSLTNPVSFGRAMRLKRLVGALAERVALADRWQVEVAAMLSQLGYVALPAETAERLHRGQPRMPDDDQIVRRVAAVTDQLLSSIPRIEVVRGILATLEPGALRVTCHRASDQVAVTLGARMLRIASDFDTLWTRGHPPAFALDTMRRLPDCYDPDLLEHFAALQADGARRDEVRDLAIADIRVGMILAEDARMTNGALLAARGYEVTPSFVERARNYAHGTLEEPLRVVVPAHLAAVHPATRVN